MFCSGSPSLVAHLGTLNEIAQARFLNGRDMHEDVLAAVVGLNKSKSLGRIEPLSQYLSPIRSPF
jgi:hypothetical protein